MDSKFLLHCLLLLFPSIANAQLPSNYRLSNSLEVESYSLNLTFSNGAFDGSASTFQGTSEVRFQLKEASSNITIHSRVNVTSWKLTRADGTQLVVVPSENSTTEIVTLILNDNGSFSNETYTLATVYEGTVEDKDMNGVYRSEYKGENNATQYLLATQFQADNARRVFPCFDEPNLKAVFFVNITYPVGYKVLGNTEPILLNDTTTPGTEKVIFTTPRMSTYLLAFVISNFTCSKSVSTANVERLCSRPESLEQRTLALNTSRKVIEVLDGITNIPYSQMGLDKIEHVAIPDFSAGAMENWGLITYREARLLWDKNESSVVSAKDIVETVAHELTHMWFGNLVTLDWWDYTFLNEGFARLYQYFATAKVEDFKSWELDKLFILEVLQYSMDYDATVSSAPLSEAAFKTAEIVKKFESISYDKGASVLRMLQNVMGEGNFTSGIRSYLNTYRFSTTKPSNLWDSLGNITSTVLPSNVTMNQAMQNWTDKRGYPVLTASMNGSTMTISQNYFTYTNRTDDTQWYVPISYILSNESSESNMTTYVWLEPGKNLSLNLEGADWAILNNKASGYYRVNYDLNLWRKINSVLHGNTSKIAALNRAQIVDDLLGLARARKLNYTTALEIVHYLKKDTDFYPWYSALTAFQYLFKVIEESSPVGMKLREYLTDLSRDIHDKSLTALNATDQMALLREVTILDKLNRLWLNHSTDGYLNHFNRLVMSGNSVNPNIRSVVYCKAVRHSNDSYSNWNFLWNRLAATKLSSEQNIILRALGCTTNQTTLVSYLNASLHNPSVIRRQDILTAWGGVISNPAGREIAVDFFTANHKFIHSLKIQTASLIRALGSGLSSEEKLVKFARIADEQGVDQEVADVIRTTVDAANATLKWKSEVRADFEAYFNITAPYPGVPANGSVGTLQTPTNSSAAVNVSSTVAPTKPANSSGTLSPKWILTLLGIISICIANVL